MIQDDFLCTEMVQIWDAIREQQEVHTDELRRQISEMAAQLTIANTKASQIDNSIIKMQDTIKQ